MDCIHTSSSVRPDFPPAGKWKVGVCAVLLPMIAAAADPSTPTGPVRGDPPATVAPPSPERLVTRAQAALHALQRAAAPPSRHALSRATASLGDQYLQMAVADHNAGFARQVAEPLFREAVSIAEHDPSPDSQDMALALAGLGETLAFEGGLSEAESRVVLVRALRMAEPLRNDDPDLYGRISLLLGELEQRLGHHAEAEARLRQTLEALRPDTDARRQMVLHALAGLGDVFLASQRWEDAIDVNRRALEVESPSPGHYTISRPEFLNRLGRAYSGAGQSESAIRAFREGLDILDRDSPYLDGPDSWQLIWNLEEAYQKSGRLDLAKKLRRDRLPVTPGGAFSVRFNSNAKGVAEQHCIPMADLSHVHAPNYAPFLEFAPTFTQEHGALVGRGANGDEALNCLLETSTHSVTRLIAGSAQQQAEMRLPSPEKPFFLSYENTSLHLKVTAAANGGQPTFHRLIWIPLSQDPVDSAGIDAALRGMRGALHHDDQALAELRVAITSGYFGHWRTLRYRVDASGNAYPEIVDGIRGDHE